MERLRILILEGDFQPGWFSALSHHYFEEARLCWYSGAFVATIVMSQLALEETLRSHYRCFKGVGGSLNESKKVDEAGFADLIAQAEHDGWISSEEANQLHKVRRDFRNPYVHPRDIGRDNDFSRPNALRQELKIAAPELLGAGAEDEARETIILLVTLFPRISRRFWGIG